MKKIWMAALIAVALFVSAPSHAQVKSWCKTCNNCYCGANFNDQEPGCIWEGQSVNCPMNGGFCSCIVANNECTATGLCDESTTDPNHSTDCPGFLNAKCCNPPYSCVSQCVHQSITAMPTTQAGLSAIVTKIDSTDVIRINPAAHPWIDNQTLLASVKGISPPLAEIVAHKAEHIHKNFAWDQPCRDIEHGSFTTAPSPRMGWSI